MKTKSQTELAQCPHCQSVFEVSQDEMELAFGAVRCGDCLKIFNASYHQVAQTPVEPLDTIIPPEHSPEPSLHEHNIPTLLEHSLLHNEPEPAVIHYEDEEEAWYEPEPAPELNESALYEDEPHESESHEYEPDPDFESELLAANTDHAATEISLQADADDLLFTETREPAHTTDQPSKTPTRWLVIAAALILPLLLVAGWLFHTTPQQNQYYLISDVRVAPAVDPQKMEIQFQLGNSGNSELPLPNLNIELLNLSLQPIANQTFSAGELRSSLTSLRPGSHHAMTILVDRPATFVQTARIHPTKPESSL